MRKKRKYEDEKQSNILSSKSDKSGVKMVTLSNEFIATFTQIIFQDP
jgi:hypothetical protein